MTWGNPLHPLAPVIVAAALTFGASTATIGVAGPRDENNRTGVQTPDESRGEAGASLDAAPAGEAQEVPPSLEFGSAAAAAPVPPEGSYEEVEPIIEEPTQEQVAAAEQPIATEALPIDQVGERDSDDDKVPDSIDNCPTVYNIDQSDDDGDGLGNACGTPPEETAESVESDTDGDGVPDQSDNCWQLANPTQKDGDGDGLGNGCDEGSAPYLTPDEDEVVEAQRFVQDPTLTLGDSGAQQALAAPQQPVELTEGETVAAPDESGQRGEREGGNGEGDRADGNGERTADEDGRPADNGDNGEAREGGDAPERERDVTSDETETPPSSDGRSKVEQGERPRRNPALTEESGPVLPPPRSSKRFPLVSGYEAVVRIDAGALGPAEVDGRDRRDVEKDRPAKDEPTEGRRQVQRTGSETRLDTESDSNRDRPDAMVDRADGAQRSGMGPVPIEAGLNVDARSEDSSDESGVDEAASEGPSALSGVVGWQASPDLPSGSESGSRRSRDTGGPERDGKDRNVRDDAAWESDRHYDGGEATKRAGAEKVAGTGDDDLYLTQRSGKGADPDSFVYAIPVDDDGIYRVRLHFAETSAGADGEAQGKKGDRVFDVEAEGETAIEGFDIAAEVGSLTAVVKMFDIEVDDGTLELEFVGRTGQPVVSAIEVLRSTGDAADDDGGRSR